MLKLVKRISAILLAVSFFLPLTQCSQKVGDTSPPLTMSAKDAFELANPFSIMVFLLFFWPVALQLWRLVTGKRMPDRKASWIELALSVLTVAGISWLVFPWMWKYGASIRYGAFLAYASALAYGAVSLADGIRGSPNSRRLS
jgi:hypothetical protein